MDASDPYVVLGEALATVIRQAVKEAVSEVVDTVLAEVIPHLAPTGASMVDVSEAARRLGLGTTSVKKLIAAGELRSALIGRRRKVPVSAIEAYVQGLEAVQLELPLDPAD
jgi:excisionase family DNA binding protein